MSIGYLLALGVAIPLAGWAQARFGAKRVWMFALAVFLIGSILCSLSWSADSLIVFRIVEGLGGGLMLPLFSTMIMQAAAGRALGRTMSIVTLPMVVGPIIGPVIGGAILKGLDWRWLFWVNVPFCVAGFILAWRMLLDATNVLSAGRHRRLAFAVTEPGRDSARSFQLGAGRRLRPRRRVRAAACWCGTAGDVRSVFSSSRRQRVGRRQIVRTWTARVRIRSHGPGRSRALRRHGAAAPLFPGCARSGRAPRRPAGSASGSPP